MERRLAAELTPTACAVQSLRQWDKAQLLKFVFINQLVRLSCSKPVPPIQSDRRRSCSGLRAWVSQGIMSSTEESSP